MHYKNLQPGLCDEMHDSITATESSSTGEGSPLSKVPMCHSGNVEDALLDEAEQECHQLGYEGSDKQNDDVGESEGEWSNLGTSDTAVLQQCGQERKWISDDDKIDVGSQEKILSEDRQEQELESDSDSEFDERKGFDEECEAAAVLSDEERLQELEDMLSAGNYAQLWESRLYLISSPLFSINNLELGSDILSDEDQDNIWAFKLQMVSNMPCVAFKQMCFTFQHKLTIQSLYVITHCMAILSGVEPQ